MSRIFRRSAAVLIALYAVAVVPARAWSVDPTAPSGDLEDFHRHFAGAVYPYARHEAAPLGITGFEVFADSSYNREFDRQPFRVSAVSGNLPSDVLAIGRVGVRKGLPGGIDLEASYGKVAGSDLKVVAGTIQWAPLAGGLASPALAFRLTGAKSQGDDVYELRQLGFEAVLSKGFPVVTPYVGVGLVHSQGTFHRAGGDLSTSTDRPIVFGGVTLSLLVPKIHLEVERGETWQAAARIGIGF
ncbi:MAG: hypothetical protein ACM3OB_02950 [Acidobacteriota bacterium]